MCDVILCAHCAVQLMRIDSHSAHRENTVTLMSLLTNISYSTCDTSDQFSLSRPQPILGIASRLTPCRWQWHSVHSRLWRKLPSVGLSKKRSLVTR